MSEKKQVQIWEDSCLIVGISDTENGNTYTAELNDEQIQRFKRIEKEFDAMQEELKGLIKYH